MKVKANAPILFAGALLLVTISCAITWKIARTTIPEEPVYVVGAVSVLDPQRLPLYQSIAQPIAHEAGGYLPQAMGSPQMLEGELPAPGQFFVERFQSQEALQRFLTAMDDSGALKLRDEVAKVHFMLALPAYRGHQE
ncbi:MAG: DUF1330 domain-containing protein [Halioglobus sp.]